MLHLCENSFLDHIITNQLACSIKLKKLTLETYILTYSQSDIAIKDLKLRDSVVQKHETLSISIPFANGKEAAQFARTFAPIRNYRLENSNPNAQERFYNNKLRNKYAKISIILRTGDRLPGKLVCYDQTTILIRHENRFHLIYKPSIYSVH